MKKFYKLLLPLVILAGLTTGFVLSLAFLGGFHYEITQPLTTANLLIWIGAGGILALYPLIFGAIKILKGESKKTVFLSLVPILGITLSPILFYMYSFFPNVVKIIGLPILVLALFSMIKLRNNTVFRKMHLNLAIAAVFLLFAVPSALTFDTLGINNMLMEKETSGGMGQPLGKVDKFCISQIKRNCQATIGTKDSIERPSSCNINGLENMPERMRPEIEVQTLQETLQEFKAYETAMNGSEIICSS